MNRLHLLVIAPFMLLAACARSAHLDAPEGFAELEPGKTYAYRATSASGVVIAVRSEDNDLKGNIEFWTAALDYRLQKSGYTAVDQAPEKITTDKGAVGRRLRYERERNGRPHEYWVAVFVSEGRVIVVEAAGDKAFFDGKTKKQIEAAVHSVDLG
ncbi:MAG: hypothetical protein IPG04_33560 [Polyangiaceae bacterium]|jgi:hypothetical protein|nr:hypothetical protein [Polyangiaceae bacterium]